MSNDSKEETRKKFVNLIKKIKERKNARIRLTTLPLLPKSRNYFPLKLIQQQVFKEFTCLVKSRNKDHKCIIADEYMHEVIPSIVDSSLFSKETKDHKGLFEACGAKKLFTCSEMEFLDESEIKNFKRFYFFLRNKISSVKNVAKTIKHIRKVTKNLNVKFFVFFAPRKCYLTENLLEKLGNKDVDGVFGFDFVPIDNNLLCLNYLNCYREMMEGNGEITYLCARTIIKFEQFFGKFLKMSYIGSKGLTVINKYGELKESLNLILNDEVSTDSNEAELIVFDRNVDLYSVLLTPVTYDALIDFEYGISSNNQFDFNRMNLSKKDVKSVKYLKTLQKTRIPLNDRDYVYRNLRDFDLNDVGRKAKSIGEKIKEFKSTIHFSQFFGSKRERTIFKEKTAIFNYAEQCMKDHIVIMRRLKKDVGVERKKMEFLLLYESSYKKSRARVRKYIHMDIIKKERVEKVLAMLILYSFLNNGIKEKVFSFFVKELIHSYGFEMIIVVKRLMKLGLIEKRKKVKKIFKYKNKFNFLVQKLSLFVSNKKECENNIHYVFAGTAPYSIQFINYFLSKHYVVEKYLSQIVPISQYEEEKEEEEIEEEGEDIDNENKGEDVEKIEINEFEEEIEINKFEEEIEIKEKEDSIPLTKEKNEKRKNIVLFFVGGISRPEIAALRLMEKNSPYNFTIITTDMLSTTSFVDQFM